MLGTLLSQWDTGFSLFAGRDIKGIQNVKGHLNCEGRNDGVSGMGHHSFLIFGRTFVLITVMMLFLST